MILRLWEEKDLAQIAELEKECFSDPWDLVSLRSSFLLPVTRCFLAEEEGQVCGYCILSVLFEDAEILNIAVGKKARRRGIGEALLSAALERATLEGAERCFLEVRENNVAAQALYRKFDFETYGLRKGYYADGENALAMKKTLTA